MSFHLLCLNTLQVLRQEFPSQPSKFYSLVDLQCKYDLSEVFFFFKPPGISHSLCYTSAELGSYLHYTSYETYFNNFLRVFVLCKI